MTTGEDAEFTALVRRQSGFVYRVSYAVLLDARDAEDAVQETFLKLYRNGQWRKMENERAFLARVAWRIAVDRRPRKAVSLLPFEDDSTFAGFAQAAASTERDPEQILLAASEQAKVHGLIDALPEELRVPLVFAAFEELNSREVSHILDIPEGTVRTRLMRARQILKQKLAALSGKPIAEARHA